MTGYIYNTDTKLVHAILTSKDQSKIEAAANMCCDDEYALTYTPSFGSNDGLEICEETNQYDLDDDALDWAEMTLY